jgi:hypothetical protein
LRFAGDGRFQFESNPSIQNERRQPLARLTGQRSHCLEAASDGGRVDAQQAQPSNRRHVDRAAVDHGANQHRVGARRSNGCRNRCLRRGNSRNDERGQKMHSQSPVL